MKKLITVVSVLVLILAFSGVASAARPEPQSFTITGHTTSYGFDTLPSGLTKFHLTAQGTASGYLSGNFDFEEWGIVDLDPLTLEGSGRGINHGIMTVTNDSGAVTIRFGGKTDSQSVWGNFRILNGEGVYRRLRGQGTYSGSAAFDFSVTFTGSFHDGRK